MVRAGGGTFIVSRATASLRGSAQLSAFASAKFALRGLTQLLAREFQPQGVRVAHIILDEIIDIDRSRELNSLDPTKMMHTGDIAEACWQLANQSKTARAEQNLRTFDDAVQRLADRNGYISR